MTQSRRGTALESENDISAVSFSSLVLPCGDFAAFPKQWFWLQTFRAIHPLTVPPKVPVVSITGPIIRAHLSPPKSQRLRRHPWCLINKARDSRRRPSRAEYISLTLRQPAWLRGSDVFLGARVPFDHLSRRVPQISPGVFDGRRRRRRRGGGKKKNVLPPFIKLKQGVFFLPVAPLFCLPTDKEQRARSAAEKTYRAGRWSHKDKTWPSCLKKRVKGVLKRGEWF